MYNIYITKINQILDLGTDEHLTDAIARAQRAITDWSLDNGAIIEIVGPSLTGAPVTVWKYNVGEPYPMHDAHR